MQQLHRATSSPHPRCPPRILASASASNGCMTSQFHRSYASVSATELQFGQPVYETHPHLLRPGEGLRLTSHFIVDIAKQLHQ